MMEAQKEPGFAEMNILVVEDSGLSFALIEVLLESLTGRTPDRAIHGQDAVEKVQETTYDLVIMDHLMPVMSGVEATRTIRSLIPAWKQPFIAGLSGATTEMDLRTYHEVGMDYFLAKPMRMTELRGLLNAVAGRTRQDSAWTSLSVLSDLAAVGVG